MSVSTRPTARPRRIDHLTALRFLAALMVFVVHLNYFLPGSWPLDHLSVGVSFFFVLSGFVLTWSARPEDGAASVYRRRIARIVPVYLLAWLGGVILTIPEHAPHDLKTLIVTVTLMQAWIPNHHMYFRVNLVAWSLSCEAFFYLCFPFVLRALRRLSARALSAVGIASIAATGVVFPLVSQRIHDPQLASWFIYIFPGTRFAEFLLGMVLGLALRNNWRIGLHPLWPAVLLLGALIATYHVPERFGREALTVVPIALLIVSVAGADLGDRASVLGAHWLIRLGEWSFAFYMVHTLWFRAAAIVLPRPTTIPVGFAIDVAVLVLSIASAGAVYQRYEMPLERRLRHAGTGGRFPRAIRDVGIAQVADGGEDR